MTATLRVLAAVFLLLASLTARPAADQDQASPPQPFRSGVNIVRVDVIVTDSRGNPVTDLTAADFEIVEDGKAQTIEQFRQVQADGRPDADDPLPRTIRDRDDEALEASRDDVRIFAILLADYQVCWERTEPVRDALTRFIRTQLGPRDLIAVMSPLTPVRTLIFTYDHEQAVREIRQFTGRKGDYTPRNAIESEQWLRANEAVLSGAEVPAVMDRIRDAVVRDALIALSVRVGSIRDGRKSIVFVSEGFRSSFGSMALDLREITKDANRHHASIYPFDARGFGPLGFGPGSIARPGCPGGGSRETLRDLADDTDGRAIVDTDRLTEGLAQIVRDASSYYLLGYTPSASHNDGKFHSIRVRVKRPGMTVSARKGYWAVTAADATRAAAVTPIVILPAQRALGVLASADANRFVYRWVGTERGTDGRVRVTVAWEPKADRNRAGWQEPGRVGLMVATEEGQVVFRARTSNEFRTAVAGGTTPSARREFLRSDRLLVRFDSYAPEGVAANMTAALVSASGRKMADVRIAPAPNGGTHQIDMGLGAFIHGEYVLEIRSGDAVEFVPFRITG